MGVDLIITSGRKWLSSEHQTIKAFVIGPIGDRDAPHGSEERRAFEEAIQIWEEVIVPACAAFGIEPDRADRIARTGEIPDQIFRLLRDSDLVIADLTGANPNVMYELGLRHTTGKLTVQLGERGRLPFDVSAIRTILFKRSDAGLVEARKRLTQTIAVGLEDGGDPVTATRVWFETGGALAIDLLATSAEEESDELGFLEKIAEAEEGMHSLITTLGNGAAIVEEIAALMQESTAQVDRLNRSGGNFAARLQVANRLAARLEDPASRFEVVSGELASSIRRIDPGIRYLLQRLAEEPDQLTEAPDFPKQIRALIEAAESSIPQTESFLASIRGVGEAARSLRRVAHRIGASLQSMIDSSRKIIEWKPLVDGIPDPGEPQ